ncbi:hypothetical protein HDU78_003167 [Chytriomyces hyalinus]|nr:hypothetical protein HDU78_003167 [Chytriomyces hyalinus]
MVRASISHVAALVPSLGSNGSPTNSLTDPSSPSNGNIGQQGPAALPTLPLPPPTLSPQKAAQEQSFKVRNHLGHVAPTPQPFKIPLPALFPVSKGLPHLLSRRFNRSDISVNLKRSGNHRSGSETFASRRESNSAQGSSMDSSGVGDLHQGSTGAAGLPGESMGTPVTPTINISKHGKRGNATGVAGVSVHVVDSGNLQGGTDAVVDKKRSTVARNDSTAEIVAPVMNPDESYTPFHLSDKSSFNAARLPTRQMRKMDRLTLAKYKAYEKPDAEIIQNIDESNARAKVWHRQQHKRIMEQYTTMKTLFERKRGYLAAQEEQMALEHAKQAADRMKEKFQNMSLARETELAFLVEGQPNSIDAIRLKEYLSTKAIPVKVHKSYTDRDRLRVEELMSIRR